MIRPRYHAFDALRAVAMLLGLWLHASIPYLEFAPAFWAVYEEPASTPLMVAFVGIHAFRMQLFFVMAGFFARLLVEKRGVGSFARNRAVRVVVPWAVGLVVLSPALIGLWIVGWVVTGRPEAESNTGFCYPAFHLWFLEYLLWMYAATLGLRWVWQRVGMKSVPLAEGRVGSAFGAVLRSPVRAFVLAVPVGLLLWWVPGWDGGPTRGCVGPEWASLAYYAVFFWVGWGLHAQRERLAALGRWWGLELGAGLLVLLPVVLMLHSARPGDAAAVPVGLDLAGHSASSVLTCLLVFGVMGLFVRRFERPSAVWRYVSDASYWLYLTHLPVQIAVGLMMLAVDWPVHLEFGVVLIATTGALLAVYHVAVRPSFIGRVLNGPRLKSSDMVLTPTDGSG